MDFGFSEEQDEIRRQASRFLTEHCPATHVRDMLDDDRGYSPDIWSKMAENGWMGLTIPEEYDGVGLGFLDLVLILEEMGKVNLPSPFIPTVVLAVEALLAGGSEEQKKQYLPPIAMGEAVWAFALAEESGVFDCGSVQATAEKQGGDYVLNGTKLFVQDAHNAQHLIVVARTGGSGDDGVSCFIVDGSAPGLKTTLLKTMDATRKQCAVELDGVRVPAANLLGGEGQGAAIVCAVMNKGCAALSAEAVGGSQWVLETTVEYAKTRMQFDRPIGGFQAVKHPLADMLLELESGKSVTYYAAWTLDENHAEKDASVAMAKAYTSDAFREATYQGIQLHGGIGFTWEHDMHLYFKRAKNTEFMFGDPSYHRERLAQILEY